MLPPEVNSGRMYAGPGSGPLLVAAQAWETIAAELHSASHSYQSVVSGLTAGPWLGPSSVMMAAAATSYVAWLSRTAAQAEETASQARVAVAAYEAAFAATVPVPVVAANRSLLMSLVATNVLGQNTAAIAATEAEYSEMWAQDAGAMYDYEGSAASATQLTPFTAPQHNTNPAAPASHASAAGETSGAGRHGKLSRVSRAVSTVPQQLSSFLTGGTAESLSPLDILDLGADVIAFGLDAPMAPLGAISLPIDLIGAQTGLHTDDIVSGWQEAGSAPQIVATPAQVAATPNVVSTPVAAALREADVVGGVSVPPTWIAATPAVEPVALALPAAGVGTGGQAMAASLGSGFGEMALANTIGRVVGDGVAGRGSDARKPAPARLRATSVATTAIDEDATTQAEPRVVVTGVAAEIRDFARLRDEGLISDQEFIEQRNHLLGR